MGWFTKKKNPQEELAKRFAEALKVASENAQKIQNAIFHKQRPYSDDFGLCEQNPIFTSSLSGTEQYLSKVCTNKGEKFTWSRCRSIRTTVAGQPDVPENVYTLFLNEEAYTELYFVLYCGESEAPPAGLYFCDDSTDWDIRREAYSKGVTVDHLLEIRKLELEEKLRKEKAERDFKQAVERKAQQLKTKYPNVSIEAELHDEIFASLASVDVDLLVAYEYVHKDELLFKKKSVVTSCTECDTAQSFFDAMNQMEYDENPNADPDYQDLQREAVSHGITIEQMRLIRTLEIENAKIKREMRTEALQKFANQAVIVKSSYPNFNLRNEWSNITFREITEKCGMLIAYEILHFSECYLQDVQGEVVAMQEPAFEGAQNKMAAAEKSVVENALFCRKCGAKLLPDSAFCYKCGTQVILAE